MNNLIPKGNIIYINSIAKNVKNRKRPLNNNKNTFVSKIAFFSLEKIG
jgi:hypothetical protein